MDYKALLRKPGLQQGIQRDMSVMPWQQAVPNTRRTIQAHASDMAREEFAGTEHTERLGLAKRLHTEEMGLQREGLGIARKQGRLATGLGVANLGLQGLAGILQVRDANEKVRLIKEAQQHYLDAGDMDGYWNTLFAGYLTGGE